VGVVLAGILEREVSYVGVEIHVSDRILFKKRKYVIP